MEQITKRAIQKCLSLLLAAAMLVTMQGIPAQAAQPTRAQGAMPANPVHHCTKKDDGTDITDWNYVYFGSYPQTEVTGDALTSLITGASYDANGDAWVDGTRYRRISRNDTNSYVNFGSSDYRYFKWQRIRWRVLQNNGSTLFVVANRAVDCKDYHEDGTAVTWEGCSLRSWLNGSFYETAFSSEEQEAIVEQTVVNEGNPDQAIEGGSDTTDKVYLLSRGDVTNPSYGFCEDYHTDSVSRCLKPSDYAYAMGVNTKKDNSDYLDNCWWWLRGPGARANAAAVADYKGYVYKVGVNVDDDTSAVEPALHIDLSSDLWSLTDDGSSGEGNEKEVQQFKLKLPTLSEDMAKQFLAFAYNDSEYEKLDFTEDKYYQFLIGDFSSIFSIEELKQRMWAFSTFVRASMNHQVSDSGYRADYLSDELCSYLREGLGELSKTDTQTVSVYTEKADKLFKQELENILGGMLAQDVGIVITESALENVKLTVTAKNDFANLPNEISDYVNKIVAVMDGALNDDVKGRAMYFNSYLNDRGSYNSADDAVFTAAMENNRLAITEGTDLSEDFAKWITGQDSWDAHTAELNAWAEYLYQLEQCIAVSRHEYVITTVEPTCTEKGYTQYACALCGRTDRIDNGEALGHSFTDYISNHDMTCEKDGTKTAVCDNGCGQSSTVTEEGTSLGHILEKINAKEATCTEKGNAEYWKCERCNNLYRDEEGSVQASLKELTSEALGHSKRITDNGDGTHSVTCTRCNTLLEEGGHRGGKATCIARKKCEVCDAEYGNVDLSAHEWNDREVLKTSTCTEKGEIKYTCTVCGETRTEEIEATGHKNTEIRNQKEATCTTEGYSGDVYCRDCNTQLETGQVIAAGVHKWDDGEEMKSPTCTEKGEIQYTCTACGATKTEETEATGHRNTEVRNRKRATCEEAGYSGDLYCRDCNAQLETGQVIAAGGHGWNDGEEIKSPSCTEKGEIAYTCTVCGATKTEETEATGHRNTEVRNRKRATCEEAGYSGDVFCKDCDTRIETGQVIAATGEHTWNDGEETKAPSCTEKGEIAYTCTVCGVTKTEQIEAADHKNTEIRNQKEATCEEAGYSGDVFCKDCDTRIETGQVIAATGEHTYETVIVKATTAKNGNITEKCITCSEVKSSQLIYRAKSVSLKSSSYTYNGKTKKPTVTVKDSRGKRISKENYKVTYKNNKKIGKATITIKLKGNYSGTLKKTFRIIPKGTFISGKIAAKSKGFQVKWKKQKKNITGYQVQYSTNKKFKKKITVTKTVKKKKKKLPTKLTVKKLKPKKKYYVRVRTYKTVKGKKYYSKWSKSKKVTTKK